MGFFKGVFNFIVMLLLSICLMVWFGYGLMNGSILSLEENQKMMETTSFTEEVTDEMLNTYHMSLSELNFDKEVLLKFVNDSASGVLGYVFLEYDEMPSVDVSFIKDYVSEQIEAESQHLMEGNVNMSEMLTTLRQIPEGTSVSNTIENYVQGLGNDINQSEIDKVAETFLENKDLDDEALLSKLIEVIAVEKLNLDQMNTDLSLQQLFDRLMTKNPFTILRVLMKVVDKNINGYIFITMILFVLLFIVTEFRIGTTSVWIALALVVSIVPLQLIRLADIFINYELLDIFGGLTSYKNFMMDALISKLNTYSIVVLVVIVVLFVLSRVFRKRVDDKIEKVESGKSKITLIARVVGFAVLILALYLNTNAMINYNKETIETIKSIEASDFDPMSIDLTLRDLLNIDFDF